ncbi:hypothetical protein PENNAL_c0046G08604, partial [Penicillium nalgiovense]
NWVELGLNWVFWGPSHWVWVRSGLEAFDLDPDWVGFWVETFDPNWVVRKSSSKVANICLV